MDFETLKSLEHDHVMQTYGRFDLALDHGEGCVLYDSEGNAYLDLSSGIGVNALGHNHPELTKAIADQAGKLMQASNLFYTEPMVSAAAKLTALSGMDKVFYANSGAEANEGIIKIARKYSWDKYHDPSRMTILTLKNSFHGRTIATLEATGQDKFHTNFFPFTDGFDYVEANNMEALEKAFEDKTVCGIMMELVQGESGVRPLDPAFVERAAKLCEENDVLLMIDEVQTGIGRTGTFFAYEHYGLHPDLVSTAKGLGGGVPIGAVLACEKTSGVLGAGDHGTTFGGNPLAAAAANVVLDTVGSPEFLKTVADNGEYFMEQLRAIDSETIQDVRGLGLMIGIQVGADQVAEKLAQLREHGVLAIKAGTDTIRLLPPLILERDQIDTALNAFREVFV